MLKMYQIKLSLSFFNTIMDSLNYYFHNSKLSRNLTNDSVQIFSQDKGLHKFHFVHHTFSSIANTFS